ncbi:diguanylate cyclase [Halodesulfovibrio spirochaetisodalis]|uniref:Diguanylate cyclase n=1 Tax=Halodesulfovibrio spirochaetisodalis TaxID=1560234 RepID=A0A1B7X9H3_9BACT|nr:diguanylate cyclase [Halodesulfovibrio spirochaetisodalis]OBQ45982.1 diguanylate cyclase [Halodesulfovibrio spirochaetisodalis]
MDQRFYQTLLDAITDGVYFVDTNKNITYWNKSAERLSGYTAEEVVGNVCSEKLLRHETEDGCVLCNNGCPLSATLKDGKERQENLFMHHKLGHKIPINVQAYPMIGPDGNIAGAVEIFSENNESLNVRREMEVLRKEVLTDKLTGIGNRRYAEITMRNLDFAMEQNHAPFGILFIDIDDFKLVNDTYGHHAGDNVLRMVAQNMSKSLRFLDVLCRWGGEEFVIFIPNTTFSTLSVLAERLRLLIQNSWLMHENQKISVTASFGGAIARSHEPSSTVLSRADKQLYLSKDSGRNCIYIDIPEQKKVASSNC